MSVLKVETDIITSMVMILLVMQVETFKTDIIVLIGNVIVCLASHWPIFSSIRVDSLILTISLSEIKGKMAKLLTISLSEIKGKMSQLLTISLSEIKGKMAKLLTISLWDQRINGQITDNITQWDQRKNGQNGNKSLIYNNNDLYVILVKTWGFF
jgi:hypothetical protein